MSKKERAKCVVCSSEDCDMFSSYQKAKNKNLFDNLCTNLLSIKKLSLDNLSLCSTCLDKLETLMETKERMDSAELRVRKLQGRILKELGVLDKQVNMLIKRLKNFEENIDEEDGLCLLRSSVSKVTKDLLQFRNNSVGRDCGNRNYNAQTEIRKPTKHKFSSNLTFSSTTNCTNDLLQVNMKGEEQTQDIPDDDQYFPFFEPDETDDNNAALSPEYNETNGLETHESNLEPVNDSPNEGTRKGKRKRAKSPSPIRRTRRIKTQKVCSNEFVYDTDNSAKEDVDDYNPPSNKSSTDSDAEPEAGSKIETLRRRQKQSSSINKQAAPQNKGTYKRLEPPDMTGMSPFKKLAFQVLLRKGTWVPDPSENNSFPPNSAEYHLAQAIQEQKDTQISYSKETKSLHLKGLEIHINEEEERIQCSACPYSTQLKRNAGNSLRRAYRTTMKVLMNHFMTHLKNYHCPICKDSEAFNIAKYIFHLKAHLNIHPYPCKICGMPLSSDYSLKLHLWTHMNEEEKTEAVKKGKYKRPNNERTFPCSICGKLYNTNRAVKQHETGFHNKEKVLCVKCGQFIRKEYYGRHVKFICPTKDSPRLKCIYCDKTYKLKISLDKHVLRTHSQYANERKFQCTVCVKSFKLLEDLNRHMKLHSTDMIYECGKGCGRTFSATRYWRKHERVCGTPEFEERVAWGKRKQKRKSDEIVESDGEEEEEEEDDEEDEVY